MATTRYSNEGVTSYDIKNERPEFSEIMKEITPGATPALTYGVGGSTRSSRNKEITWGSYKDSAILANDPGLAEMTGETDQATEATRRHKNYHQKFTAWFNLDNRAAASKQYGKKELARLTYMFGARLKHKIERMLTSKQLPRVGQRPNVYTYPDAKAWVNKAWGKGSTVIYGGKYYTTSKALAKSAGLPGTLTDWVLQPDQSSLTGGLFCYLKTNNSRGATGTAPVHSSDGLPTSTGTDGTNRELTPAIALTNLHAIKSQGLGFPSLFIGNIDIRDKFVQDMVKGTNEAQLTATTGDLKSSNISSLAKRGAVAVLLTSGGTFEVHHSDYMPTGNGTMLYQLNPEYLGLSHIGKMYRRERIASTGDFKRYYIIADIATMVYGEEACGVVSDLSAPA